MATKFFKKFKKVLFSLMDGPLPPPPLLMARPLREELFFAASLLQLMCIMNVKCSSLFILAKQLPRHYTSC